MDDTKGSQPMSERVAICRSSADIPMESVEECIPVIHAHGDPVFTPTNHPAWMAAEYSRRTWDEGRYEIYAFKPTARVAEKPIDWTRFLSADFVGERIADYSQAGGYFLKAGTVFLSGNCVNRQSVQKMLEPSRRDYSSTATLAGSNIWDGTNCRVIRHPDGTWAPGYGPDGPIETSPVAPRLNMAKWVDEIVEAMLASYRLPKPTTWTPPVILATDTSPSLVAAIPDLPRDHHAPLKHLVPRWRTPRYEAPGRWRK